MDISDETQNTLDQLVELGRTIPTEQAIVMTIGVGYDALEAMHCDVCRVQFLTQTAMEAVTAMLHNYNTARSGLNAKRH